MYPSDNGMNSAIKRSELLTPAPAWHLENILVCNRSQAQKTTYCVVPFIWRVQKREIHRHRKQTRGCQEWGGLGSDCKQRRGFLWGDLSLGHSDGCTTVNRLKNTDLHTLSGWIVRYVNSTSTQIFFFFHVWANVDILR